ncbi:histidinol-phosphate transaminase [Marilutibacter aestuarii]|uniref:Histidinol-phosphate aminotransferase n=1 Tax=Marilutibacter aestuarii TaxID=1706195 RepID=A0A508AMQ7_9GAMM|nr:histidinol-phosphate transaminase [Lysobacter aestuarii]TQD49774.1 histidinol-phosphate transaminase [Lysobacter aestuarii]
MSARIDDAPASGDAGPARDEAWFASRATPGIRGLKAYDPGHDLVAFRRRFGELALVELGSNENPYGPSADARAAILDQLHALHRYPDPLGGDLKRALAAVHGVPIERLMLGNGSHELLMQLAQAFAGPGQDVVFPRHGFAVFALATQAAGATTRIAEPLPRDAAMPLGHDLEAVLAAITPATRLVYLANPNNPTGTWFGRQALAGFLARVPGEVIVVVDEAYAEMADAPDYGSALERLDAHPNLVVTRTFSKAYGLAGLRVGYLLAAPGLVAVMERLRESFNVNGLALAACEAALGDTAHLRWACERNAEQRASLAAALQARGLEVFPSQTNFILVGFGRDAGPIEAALAERGVVLRPMGGYGLPDCLRISVGNPDENRRLLAALDEVMA